MLVVSLSKITTTKTNIMKKSINLNGTKKVVNLEIVNTENFESLGSVVRYKYYEGNKKVVSTINAVTKREAIYTINGASYKVYYVNTNKTNRAGFLVSGISLEYNGNKFSNDKKIIEHILTNN